jgi:hypothetical protein
VVSDEHPAPEILDYYALGGERGRLEEAYFPLERTRTQELVRRHLPPPPGVVLDVGGAAGAYALWLAPRREPPPPGRGAKVTLSSELRYRLLLELSQRISRTLDLQVVLDDLRHVLRTAVAYDAAGVFVLNRTVPLVGRTDPNLIAGMVQHGFDDPPVDDPMLRSGKGIAVRGAMGRPAAEALRAVIDATGAFSGREPYDDDFTLVVVRRDAALQ